MSDPDLDTQTIEKAKISQLIADWGMWRDAGDWDRLRSTYTADATMATSWMDGTAADFIDGCRQIDAGSSGGFSAQHLIGASTIDINGKRASAATRVSVLIRLSVHGIESDLTAIGRFHDLLLRTGPNWRIRRRVPVFDKDFVRPVNPAATLHLDEKELSGFPAAYRFLCYVESGRGMKINPNLPAPNSPAISELYAQARAWVDGK